MPFCVWQVSTSNIHLKTHFVISNHFGQLGLGKDFPEGGTAVFLANNYLRCAANLVNNSKEPLSVASVKCGDSYSVVLLSNGKVIVFGHTFYGQCGVANTNESAWFPQLLDPEAVFLNRKIIKIFCGLNYTMFIDELYDCWTCGENANNQLMQGEEMKRVMAPTRVVFNHGCAVPFDQVEYVICLDISIFITRKCQL